MAGRPRDEHAAERFLVDAQAEKLRAQALLALVDAAPGAIDELGPDEALPLICARLLRAMGCTTAVLSLVDRRHETLESVAGYDVSGVRTAVRGSRSLAGDATAARVIADQEPLLATADPGACGPARMAGPAAQIEWGRLALPLVVRGESIGMIELLAGHREWRYSSAELVLAQGVYAVISRAAADVPAFDGFRPPAEILPDPDGRGQGAAVGGAAADTLVDIARRLAEGLEVQHCDVLVRREGSGAAKVVARYQAADDAGAAAEPVYGLGELGVRARAAAERRIAVARDDDLELSVEERAEMVARGQRAVMYAPIVVGDEVVGFLGAIERRHARRFTPADEAFAGRLAGEAGVAVASARAVDRLDTQNQELRLLLETGAAIAASVDLGATLSTINQRLVQTLGVAWSDIYDYRADTDELEVIAFHQVPGVPPDADWLGRRLTAASWPEGLAAVHTRRPQTMYYDYSRLSFEDFVGMAVWGEQATLTVPLICGDEVLGVLDVAESRYPRRFTADEVRLAEAIGAQAAVAIHNARAYERLETERVALARLNRRLSAFAELSGQMRGLLSEEQLIDLLGRVLHGALEFNQWVIYLYEPETQLFRAVKAFGGTPEIDEHYAATPVPARVMSGLIDSARIISHSYFVDHQLHTWSDEENYFLPGEELVGERPEGEWDRFDSLFVPMLGRRDQLIGYVEAYDPQDRQRPTEEVVRLIEVFAGKAASNIELQRAYGELEEQSRTDGLTGLYNHRFFQERLAAEVARAQRFAKPLTLLMIDVDNFKEFNDAFGHPEGDRLLRSLVDLLLAQTRAQVDVVARYGGEEFVVLLLETGVGDAAAAAERLQDSVEGRRPAVAVAEAIRTATQAQTFETAGGLAGGVSVSVGVATFPDHASTGDQLVANADKALYHAKRLGKNRTCVYRI